MNKPSCSLVGPLRPGVATPRGRHSQGAYTNIRRCSAGVNRAYGRCYSAEIIILYSRCCSVETYTGDAVLLEYYNYGRCCSAIIYKGDSWEWRPLGVVTPNRQVVSTWCC